jgi:hypothetical protein
MTTESFSEDQAWADAYGIAYVGASNPTACASRLAKHSAALVHEQGTMAARKHPALRAIAGHLAYLYGYGLGPDIDLLDQVEVNAKRLGIFELGIFVS